MTTDKKNTNKRSHVNMKVESAVLDAAASSKTLSHLADF